MTTISTGDKLTLTTADDQLVTMTVTSVAPTEPPYDVVQVVFRTLSPIDAAAYHAGLDAGVTRYAYKAPAEWKLKIGDQLPKNGSLVTVVGYGPTPRAARKIGRGEGLSWLRENRRA